MCMRVYVRLFMYVGRQIAWDAGVGIFYLLEMVGMDWSWIA